MSNNTIQLNYIEEGGHDYFRTAMIAALGEALTCRGYNLGHE